MPRITDPLPDPAEENWIVSVRGKLGGQRTAQTYELARASLELSYSMADVDDLRGPWMLRPSAQAFVLRGVTTGGTIELLPETTGELNAALQERDATITRLTEENERLRAAARRLGEKLTWLTGLPAE